MAKKNETFRVVGETNLKQKEAISLMREICESIKTDPDTKYSWYASKDLVVKNINASNGRVIINFMILRKNMNTPFFYNRIKEILERLSDKAYNGSFTNFTVTKY